MVKFPDPEEMAPNLKVETTTTSKSDRCFLERTEEDQTEMGVGSWARPATKNRV